MCNESDRQYYQQRSAEERAKARAAASEAVAKVHEELAQRYQERAEIRDRGPNLKIAVSG